MSCAICISVMLLLSEPATAEVDRDTVVVMLCEKSHSVSDSSFEKELKRHVTVETADCADAQVAEDRVYIAEGFLSARDLLSNIALSNSPKVIVGLYEIEHQGLAADYPSVNNVLAIPADPAPVAQLALAESLFPLTPRLLLLFSAKSVQIRDNYLQRAKTLDIDIIAAEVRNESDALRHIQANPEVDAILAVPDQDIYNRYTLPILLRTSYVSNIPMLGYSPQLVKLGALATTYLNNEALVSRVLASIDYLKNSQMLASVNSSELVAPLRFDKSEHRVSVRVNRSVTNSLNMVVAQQEVLERQVNVARAPKRD